MAIGLVNKDYLLEGDMLHNSAGCGTAYGEIWYMDGGFDTALAAQDTWYQILGFATNGSSNLTTPDHTNDHITVSKTGIYLVSLTVASRSTNLNAFEFMVKTNNGGTDCTNVMVHRTVQTAGRMATGACAGLCSLTANDTVELWVQRTDGGAVSKTITIEHVTLNVTMFGG